MNLFDLYNLEGKPGVSDIFTLAGSLGVQDGIGATTERTEEGFRAVHEGYTVTAAIEEREGVHFRTDTLTNTGDAPLGIHRYACRFALPGGACDVYTQKSHGQHESLGEWTPLVTQVSATAGGMFIATDATPMIAVYDRISRRGVAFHLLPHHAWQMTASRVAAGYGREVFTVVEIALYDPAPRLTLAPGETLALSPKATDRRAERILYFRDSTSIEDLFTHMGITQATFAVMDKKIERGMRNDANRLANCDANNISKAISVSMRQTELIRRLIEENKISFLPPKLEATARLRLQYEGLSVGQLAEMATPPLTKSGLHHRLEKITELAEALLEDKKGGV